MNILFVVKEHYSDHLGIMLLAALLKKKGHFVYVTGTSFKRIRHFIKEKECSIIAYSVPTIYYEEYLAINKKVKDSYDMFSVFGGAHPTFVPNIIEEPSIDCICRGEGEEAIVELVERLSAKQEVTSIRNLWIKQDGTIHKNPVRPLITNLDALPFPDRKVLPYSETYTKGKLHVMTSRGCPFECAYCSHPAFAKIYGVAAKRIRRRSVNNVIAEIVQYKHEADISFVMFEDDLFVLDSEWLTEFTERYDSEVGLPFFCYVRANCITPEIVQQLKKAGCVTMSMGIETANDEVRNGILGRAMTCKEIHVAARTIKKAGIRLEGLNIVGIPGSTIEDDFSTIRLNAECRVDYAAAKLLMPYPQTAIREYTQKKGLLKDGYDQWQSSIVFSDAKTQRGFENLRRLFGLSVAFPFLVPLIKKMIYWPLDNFYQLFNRLWEGYTAFFRLYPTGWKGFLWGMRKYSIMFRCSK